MFGKCTGQGGLERGQRGEKAHKAWVFFVVLLALEDEPQRICIQGKGTGKRVLLPTRLLIAAPSHQRELQRKWRLL